jgi:hypothetical protein
LSDTRLNNNIKINNKNKKGLSFFDYLIFAIIIYLIFIFLQSISKPHIPKYEIVKGDVFENTSFRGIAVRQTKVISSEFNGFIQFLVADGSKVGAKTNVYAVTTKAINTDNIIKVDNSALSSEETKNIIKSQSNYFDKFSEKNFDQIYALRNDVSSNLNHNMSELIQSQIKKEIDAKQLNGDIYTSKNDGIISFHIDGLEGINLEKAKELLGDNGTKATNVISNNDKVSKGENIYKIVSSNKWQLITKINKDTKSRLETIVNKVNEANKNLLNKELPQVNVKFAKDDQIVSASFSLSKYNGKDLLILNFSDSLVRYIDERYLNIELELNNDEGLKIPNTAITEKKLIEIDKDYYSDGRIQFVSKGGMQLKSVSCKYASDGKYYFSPEALKGITKINSFTNGDIYDIKRKPKTKTFTGVYNIRTGYANFYPVDIISKFDNYVIVKDYSDFKYGPTEYTPIALNGDKIHEGETIF